MVEVRQYIDRRGRDAFEQWYEGLEYIVRARIAMGLDRLERGSLAAKGVGAGLMELRLDFGPGYRIYFGRDGDSVVILLGGGTKRRQRSDIEAAQDLWREYKQPSGRDDMPLTKDFNETIKADLQKSAGFRKALLREAVGAMIAGDLETGKSVLRKYINGTVGFMKLGADLGRSPKVLMRSLSGSGNPQAKSLLEIVAYLQKVDGTVLEVVDRAA